MSGPGHTSGTVAAHPIETQKPTALSHVAIIPFAKAPSRAPLLIEFREIHDVGTQARLRGRVALVPEVDLGAYHFRAVIDWIEIGLDLQAPQQFMQIQSVLGPALGLPPGRKPHVVGLNEEPNRMATKFAIRIQEPRLDRVLAAIEALDRRYPLAFDRLVFVREMEISVDARPCSPSDEARARLLAAMARTFHTQRDVWTEKDARPRFSFSGGKPTFISPTEPLSAASRDDWWNLPATKRLPGDATFYVGEKEGEVRWKVMDKVLDQQNLRAGTHVDLDEAEKRVRVEVTLGWQELHRLGVRVIEDLQTFSFIKLQGGYFSFRLPTFEDSSGPPTIRTLCARSVEATRKRIFGVVGVLGLGAHDTSRTAWLVPHRAALRRDRAAQGDRLERKRAGTGPRGTTLAWAEMNKKVEMALRHLEERVREEMQTGERAS